MASKRKNSVEENPATKKQKTDGSVDRLSERPTDWPIDDSKVLIDLAVHDLPHHSSETEWWYINSHVKLESKDPKFNGREVSVFASFFLMAESKDEKTGAVSYAHSVTWAIIDPTTNEYFFDPVLDRKTPSIVLKSLDKGTWALDKRLHKAFREMVAADKVPLPDRPMDTDAKVDWKKLDIDYGGNTFSKDKDGKYHIHCESKDKKMAFTLVFTPKKKPMRHGNEGVVKIGIKQETMFYYFIPRNVSQGTITLHGVEYQAAGDGWYDHEFGRADLSTKEKKEKDVKEKQKNYAWNWLALQLEDGTDLTATNLMDPDENKVLDKFVVLVGPNNERTEYRNIDFKGLNSWQSVRTTATYPTQWHLSVPEVGLDIKLDAVMEDQEFITLIARPAFWEGRLTATGTYKGKPIKGLAFIERHGFDSMTSLDSFFKKISKTVLAEVDKVLPLQPTYNEARDLISSTEYEKTHMQGVNIDVFAKTVIHPLREIIDRGGKSWRSFACLLCVDAVGDNSTKFRHWLSMPEIMHVGSLIVDDIQDKSDTRRGGPACHIKHGDAIAINAGTAAYFLALHSLMEKTNLTPEQRLRVYDLYFLTLRGGHAGQAFDIHGMDYMMDDIVKSGDGAKLEIAVKCTHRFKSAIPAGNLARMGAFIGKGTEFQISALGDYFESIGVAFQIIDDVLNLRGFEGKTKNRGEDIAAGKITYPVAKAMSRLNAADRQRIWNIIKSKPQDQKVIESVCDELEKCGATPAAEAEAEQMVEEAWKKVADAVPDSFFKMLLRAFGWYVLQRHY